MERLYAVLHDFICLSLSHNTGKFQRSLRLLGVRAQSAAPLRVGRHSASNFLLDAKPPPRGAALCFGARVQAPPKSYRHLGVAFLPWGKNKLSAPPHYTHPLGRNRFVFSAERLRTDKSAYVMHCDLFYKIGNH